jgi:RNA polymerase sigma factor (sigma-70 family)
MNTTTGLARQAMRSGSPAARAAHVSLLERILTRIHSYFRRMIPNAADADDCLQRTLLLIEDSLQGEKYDPDRSFNTWLWLKARTVYAQWCREQARQGRFFEESKEPEELGIIKATEAEMSRMVDARAVLEQVSRRIGQGAFETFVLYYEGGLTQAEIAEAVGCDVRTVRRRLGAAHAVIASLIGAETVAKHVRS